MARLGYKHYICLFCQTGATRRIHFRAFSTSVPKQQQDETPSIAPKASYDIRHIRQNPALYSENCINRKYKHLAAHPYRITELFQKLQALHQSARGLRERNNDLRRKLMYASPDGPDGRRAEAELPETREEALQEARKLKKQLADIDAAEEELQSQMVQLAGQLPNLASSETPIGSEPVVVGYINEHLKVPTPSPADRIWKSHVHIGIELKLLDFAAAATTSGWGWYYLLNEAAILENALVQYALHVAMRRGWEVVTPPSMVYSHIAAACGYQPRDQNGEQQVYTIEHGEKNRRKPDLSLAGTAEIPFAGMKAEQTLESRSLPLKVIGVSRCYRAEAGARGTDTKGLFRVHEFTKVEMFAWTVPHEISVTSVDILPSSSQGIFDEMLSIQSEILESLNLRCRILEMPSSDLGASAMRKRDMEAFFPSRVDRNGGWGEVTSASMCSDYQTRRLATRVRMNSSGGSLAYPFTVNGTALAVPRVLAAILENGWDEERGSVMIPEVLWPWMGETKVIRKKTRPDAIDPKLD